MKKTINGTEQEIGPGANLYNANLQGANLEDANLQRANLQRANLQRANLEHANLYGADLYNARTCTARTWNTRTCTARTCEARTCKARTCKARHFRTVAHSPNTPPGYRPAGLLTQGGKPLESVVSAWDRHSWADCPMACAFNVGGLSEVPECWRAAAALFVALFDGGHLPKPQVTK